MKRLSTELINNKCIPSDIKVMEKVERPIKVLQFGGGNFLRAFADWMFDVMNESGLMDAGIRLVQSTNSRTISVLSEQDYNYTLLIRGLANGSESVEKRVITSIVDGVNANDEWDEYMKSAHLEELKFVVSNTTESGIVYEKEERPSDVCPTSFPAKVAILLYERYKHFKGDLEKGLIFLPCELINRNGDELKAIILRLSKDWNLGLDFEQWVSDACIFTNTLVDRIVSGYPKDEMETIAKECSYIDNLTCASEVYHLWAIDTDSEKVKELLPFDKVGLNVVWTNDLGIYRERKVRLLNGLHTNTMMAAVLYGKETVKECIEDDIINSYMRKAAENEILPVLEMELKDKQAYADAVFERFANPYIKHQCFEHHAKLDFKV